MFTPTGFLQNYSPKELVFIGSRAFSDRGTAYNGLATNAVKIEILGINHMNPNTSDPTEIKNIDNRVLRLIYHESSHLLEQVKVVPKEFEQLSIADYKGGGWTRAWRGETYLKSGFISAYASDNIHEDFVETIARLRIQHMMPMAMAWMIPLTTLGERLYIKKDSSGKRNLRKPMERITQRLPIPESKSWNRRSLWSRTTSKGNGILALMPSAMKSIGDMPSCKLKIFLNTNGNYETTNLYTPYSPLTLRGL